MKQIIYNAQTKTITYVDVEEQDEPYALPVAVRNPSREDLLDLMEMIAEQQYYICLLEMGVTEDDL